MDDTGKSHWTKAEIKVLTTAFANPKTTAKDVAALVGRSPGSVNKQLIKLRKNGVAIPSRAGGPRGRVWSDNEINVIREALQNPDVDYGEVGKAIGRSRKAVARKVEKLGLRESGRIPERNRKAGATWSDEETARLLELHKAGLAYGEIAQHFPERSLWGVKNKLRKLGIYRKIKTSKPGTKRRGRKRTSEKYGRRGTTVDCREDGPDKDKVYKEICLSRRDILSRDGNNENVNSYCHRCKYFKPFTREERQAFDLEQEAINAIRGKHWNEIL